MKAYNDSNQPNNLDVRRSSFGSYISVGPNFEYYALANTTHELLWLEFLLLELGIPFYMLTLLCDNLSAIILSQYPSLTQKHKEFNIHFVNEIVVFKKPFNHHVMATAQITSI